MVLASSLSDYILCLKLAIRVLEKQFQVKGRRSNLAVNFQNLKSHDILDMVMYFMNEMGLA